MKRGAEQGRWAQLQADRQRRAEKRQQAVAEAEAPAAPPAPLTRLQQPVFGRRSPARPLYTPEPEPEPEPAVEALPVDGERRVDRRRKAVRPQDVRTIMSALNAWRQDLEKQWDMGNITTREDAHATFLGRMDDVLRDFDLSQQRLAGVRIRRVRDQAERVMAEVVATRCADSAQAATAGYAVIALVEDALAQLTDELTACAQWRDAQLEFKAELRTANAAAKTRVARVVRAEIEESKQSELDELTRRVDAERRVLGQEGALSVEEMVAQLQSRERELLDRIKSAQQEEAASNAAAAAVDEEISRGFQRRMVDALAGEETLTHSRAAQMEATSEMRELQSAIFDLKSKVAQLRTANARQQDKLTQLEVEQRRGFVRRDSGEAETSGMNKKAIIKQRRQIAIDSQHGRTYAVEGSTDWEIRIEHLQQRFNVPADRATDLLRKYRGHAGLSVSELEGIGGSMLGDSDQDGIDPNGTKELFNALDEDGSGALDSLELGQLCQRVGIAMGQDDIAAAMEDMDQDGNGEVEYAEFELWYNERISSGDRMNDFRRALEDRKHAISRSNRGLQPKRFVSMDVKRAGRAETIAEQAAADARATNALRVRAGSAAV